MSLIQIHDLTFSYDGSSEMLFDHVTLQLDTAWRLGLTGRNGRGKTTLLRLLLGELEYRGNISSGVEFAYFPYTVKDESLTAKEIAQSLCPQAMEWEFLREAALLDVPEEALERPWSTLSGGQQTKLLLAALFLGENRFLLIDEPTDHLDLEGRAALGRYLRRKQGYLLVSHDRAFLDGCVDHILSINKADIQVQKGNFSSWWENRQRQDAFEQAQNQLLKKEIRRLEDTAREKALWSKRAESEKRGSQAKTESPFLHFKGLAALLIIDNQFALFRILVCKCRQPVFEIGVIGADLNHRASHTRTSSIETQQLIIARFLEQHPEIIVHNTYIDNGATGTNFHRPAFQQMLSDIESSYVNCVIVKDLSRLGRNTIDTGYYIEQYFRIRNIRFIAVNENYDTADPEDAHSGIIIPLRNMINEAYALDIGRKIRAQQRQAMKDGKFIGARTPYGYLKAEDDCHQLIVDPVAAVVVRQMFQWAQDGAGLNTIAVRLNEQGVLPPSHYKKMQGTITHENLLGNGKWQTRTVDVILRSTVYTGDLEQGHSKTVDHKQIKASANEWTVVRDTHEAIISREQFEAVQDILNQTTQRAKARQVNSYTPNILKGKVFCSHCGGSLHRQRCPRKKTPDVYAIHCLSKSRISKDACPGVFIYEDSLLDSLADMLQEALNTALGKYTLSLEEQNQQTAERAELKEKITNRKQEIQRLRGIVRSLYENLVQGVLANEEYFDYKEKYESKIADLALEVEQLENGLRTMDEQIRQYQELTRDAESIKADRELTATLIERLIDRIEVSHDKQITVHYRFQSEFENYVEVLKQCRNM